MTPPDWLLHEESHSVWDYFPALCWNKVMTDVRGNTLHYKIPHNNLIRQIYKKLSDMKFRLCRLYVYGQFYSVFHIFIMSPKCHLYGNCWDVGLVYCSLMALTNSINCNNIDGNMNNNEEASWYIVHRKSCLLIAVCSLLPFFKQEYFICYVWLNENSF